MKKTLLSIVLLLISISLFGCSFPQVKSSIRPDDNSGLPTFAMASNNFLADAIAAELFAKGFDIIERAKLRAILEEQSLNLSGALDDANLIKAGKILNVDALIFVSGSYSSGIPDRIESAVVKIIHVETGRMLGSVNYQNGHHGAPGSMADYDMKDTMVETANRISNEIAKAYNLAM
jgi:hypothetical protein